MCYQATPNIFIMKRINIDSTIRLYLLLTDGRGECWYCGFEREQRRIQEGMIGATCRVIDIRDARVQPRRSPPRRRNERRRASWCSLVLHS